MSKCGTLTGYTYHMQNGTKPCRPCKDAKAAHQRAYNARRRRQKPAELLPPVTRGSCGSKAGYQVHMYRFERACDECRTVRQRYRGNRRGRVRDVVLDYAETHGPVELTRLVLLITDRWPDVTEGTIRKTTQRLRDAGLMVSERWGDQVVVDVSDTYLRMVGSWRAMEAI